ncbi:hypothetical protein [Actinomadura xylanilytica]|uniref:hypothetical protein n=1 Tax=Actinomadura xylanilytica TaxID=887459 RepID=UPI00255AA7E1|nr:hypothetical protein [Actinomadura xylanilytica]MDL4775997.1 hypothetical protein [Actinomadura xylanilytica]
MVRPSLAVLALTACGGEDRATMPPLTPEPGDARPLAPAGAPPEQSRAARMVLYRYLRGVAAGDAKVCASVTPAYERATFGKPGGCGSGLAAARARLRAQDRAALRTVTVPTGQAGPGPDDFTVRFEDLRWKGEPARPGGLLAAGFTLRKTGARWLITV